MLELTLFPTKAGLFCHFIIETLQTLLSTRMKTAIILLVVVAAGLCNAHTDSSKNTTKGEYI